MNPSAKDLDELREAWLDLPWHGITNEGYGDAIQRLINAATAIVDPRRELREDPEAKRRGDIASLKSQLAYKLSAIRTAEEWLESDMAVCRAFVEKVKIEVAELQAKLTEIGA